GVPGLFFYKSFAKQYAAVLGVDEKLIAPALEALREPEEGTPRPEIRVPNRLVEATNRRYVPDISLGWSVVGLVVVLLGCSGIYAWWKRAPEGPSASTFVQTTAPVTMVKASEPATVRPEELADGPAAAPVEETSGVVLKLSATERTWL